MKRVLRGFLVVLFCLCIITTMDASAEVRLFCEAVTDFDDLTGVLYELDPDTAEPIGLIGPIGYFVFDLDYDPTTNTLYGTSIIIPGETIPAPQPSPFNGLISIDMTTGAGTPVGAANWGTEGDMLITNIAVDSSGQMYGWSAVTDSLVRIDKNTGTVVEVYPHDVDTEIFTGLRFNNTDVLYLVNSDGFFYRIDTTTGQAAYEGDLGITGWHGDFHPLTGLYYNLLGIDDEQLLVVGICDLATESYTLTDVGGPLIALAFTQDSTIPDCAVLYINSDTTDGSKIFVDESASTHTVIHKGDVHHEDSVEFGGNTSICFDGKGDYLRVNQSEDWNFGQGNFTIDVWVNFAKITSVDQEIFTTTYSPLDTNGFYMRADNNKFVWYHRATGALKIYAKPAKGQWYHLAVVRAGNMLSIYVNDSREITSDCTGAKFGGSNLGLVFGKTEIGPVRYFNGYMDKIMVTKGCAPPEPPPGP